MLRRLKAVAWGVSLILCASVIALVLSTPNAEALNSPHDEHATLVDRHGALLATVRTHDFRLHESLVAGDLGPYVAAVVIAAEDKRFYAHPGIDPVAIARAAWQALSHGRVLSGASTITQQVARTLFQRERTLWGKLQELTLAVKLSLRWSKQDILLAYLNRVEFGPNIVGIQAAARHYFGAPVAALSLSQSASLVGIARGPGYYDPRHHLARVEARKGRILSRLLRRGRIARDAYERALATPVKLHAIAVWPGAHHLVRRTAAHHSGIVHTTLDARLQQRAEELVARHARRLEHVGGDGAAAIIVDNATRRVLAYVGSPSYIRHPQGQVDAITALRQPGSTLKPFVYAAAMEELGYTAATVLPDIEQHFAASTGRYVPQNYDHQFHGPVRLREALGNSYNVPAVLTAVRVGLPRVLERLRTAGFASLKHSPEHYGPALALGDGEVTLEQLATAYLALAHGGLLLPLQYVAQPVERSPSRVLEESTARLLTDILADNNARAAAFGLHSPLHFDFDVAAKTGTSKGHRDNWTVGFSSEVTIAVWVGNFDGTPMVGASGITGAGPLFHDLMLAAMQQKRGLPLRLDEAESSHYEAVEVCALSGLRATRHCPQTRLEWFALGTSPQAEDSWHAPTWVDAAGRRARADCPHVKEEVRVQLPATFKAWSRWGEISTWPEDTSPDCPPQDIEVASRVAIVRPHDGAVYEFHPWVAATRQQLVIEIAGADGPLDITLDHTPLATLFPPQRTLPWTLRPGRHHLQVQTRTGATAEAKFTVLAPAHN